MNVIIGGRIIVDGQDIGKKVDLIMEHLIKKGVMSREEKSEIVVESKEVVTDAQNDV